MCGRFTLATPPEILAALFGIDSTDWNDPRYNIAPQTRVVTVRNRRAGRVGQSLLWGAVNPKDSRPLINARSETVATSPLFAAAFARFRVLVPADGFFEWTKAGSRRQGHYFQQPEGKPFGFAGIAVMPPGPAQGEEPGVVILTTAASASVRPFHERMPVIIPPKDFDAWLDADSDLKGLVDLLAVSQATSWGSHPVGPEVNNVRNDGPGNVEPIADAPERQGSLF